MNMLGFIVLYSLVLSIGSVVYSAPEKEPLTYEQEMLFMGKLLKTVNEFCPGACTKEFTSDWNGKIKLTEKGFVCQCGMKGN